MQPINYGAGYPIYPNCFDQLTTNGVIADDVVGYITDTPSPYLQNYVAQRGWQPQGQILPGQILPDPLPNVQPHTPLPKGDVYQTVPNNLGPDTFVKKDKYKKAKEVATGLLLVGLIALGIVKGKGLVNKILKKPPTTGTASGGTPKWCQNIGTSIKGGLKKVSDFVKDTWNKIFHKTHAPSSGGPTP